MLRTTCLRWCPAWKASDSLPLRLVDTTKILAPSMPFCEILQCIHAKGWDQVVFLRTPSAVLGRAKWGFGAHRMASWHAPNHALACAKWHFFGAKFFSPTVSQLLCACAFPSNCLLVFAGVCSCVP